jgi:transposase
MHLNAHDLKQLDQDSLNRLSEAQVRALAARLLADLKEAIDRLNRTPQNSSLPPSKQAPWEKAAHKGTDEAVEDEDLSTDQGSDTHLQNQASREDDPSDAPESTPNTPTENKAPHGRPGRRPGAPGVSRTQHVPVTAERFHAPQHCAVCGVALGETAPSQPYTARHEIDVQRPDKTGCQASCSRMSCTPIWIVNAGAVIGRERNRAVPRRTPSGRSS